MAAHGDGSGVTAAVKQGNAGGDGGGGGGGFAPRDWQSFRVRELQSFSLPALKKLNTANGFPLELILCSMKYVPCGAVGRS